MTVREPSVEELYLVVSEEIVRAETLDDAGAPGAAQAYLSVSHLEDRIASLEPANTIEGAIARRGAVRAAVAAGELRRAAYLVYRYSQDSAAPEELRADLASLLPDFLQRAEGDAQGGSLLADERLPLVAPPLSPPCIYVVAALTSVDKRSAAKIQTTIGELVRKTVDDFGTTRWTARPLTYYFESAYPISSEAEHAVIYADALILLSDAPQTGSGFELAWAVERRIPVLWIHASDIHSEPLAWNQLDISHSRIRHSTDVHRVVMEWLENHWLSIIAGSLQRRELEVRLAPLHFALRDKATKLLISAADPEAELERLGRRVGIEPRALLDILFRRLTIATTSYEHVTSLAALLEIDLSRWMPPSDIGLAPNEIAALEQARQQYEWSELLTRLLADIAVSSRASLHGVRRQVRLTTSGAWRELLEDWHSSNEGG